jgi:AcrR family transcriptional regulator
MTASPDIHRPSRSDARRNYDRLLAEADKAFAAHGTGASLEEIARAAGVGIGTLYRHFPTREALLESLLRERFVALWERARQLAGSDSPMAALEAWLRDAVAQSSIYQGLPTSILAALRDDRSHLATSCQAMRAVGEQLLTNAQAAGEARADLDPTDLILLTNAAAWAAQQCDTDSDRIERHISLIMAGMRINSTPRRHSNPAQVPPPWQTEAASL